MEVFDDRAFRDMAIECDIKPILAASTILILWPFCFNFAALPGEDEDNTGHVELERIMFFELHSQYLGLSRDKTQF